MDTFHAARMGSPCALTSDPIRLAIVIGTAAMVQRFPHGDFSSEILSTARLWIVAAIMVVFFILQARMTIRPYGSAMTCCDRGVIRVD